MIHPLGSAGHFINDISKSHLCIVVGRHRYFGWPLPATSRQKNRYTGEDGYRKQYPRSCAVSYGHPICSFFQVRAVSLVAGPDKVLVILCRSIAEVMVHQVNSYEE